MNDEKTTSEILESREYKRVQGLMIDFWMLLRRIWENQPALPTGVKRTLDTMVDPKLEHYELENIDNLQKRQWLAEEQRREADNQAWITLGIPDALLKANGDEFEYACGLRDGRVFYFERAEFPDRPQDFHGWVHLVGIRAHTVPAVENPLYGPGSIPFNFERGLDVRLSQIAWVADAPYGS